MNSLNKIFKSTKHLFSESEKDLIGKSFYFAKKAHLGQKRNSGEPYFNHVFETAKNLAFFGMDVKTIAAGFLHDTIEDTDTTEKDILDNFDKEIAFLVMS